MKRHYLQLIVPTSLRSIQLLFIVTSVVLAFFSLTSYSSAQEALTKEKIEQERFSDMFGVAPYTTLMHQAAQEGDREKLEKYLKLGASINLRDGDERTPLMEAIREGHLEVARWLVEQGADVNLEHNMGNNVLYFVAKGGGSIEDFDWFVKKGAKLKSHGWHPLLGAAIRGDVDLVGHILGLGIPVGAQDTNGYSALDLAALFGNAELVDYLIKQGAPLFYETDQEPDSGPTALAAALEAEDPRVDIIKRILTEDHELEDLMGGGFPRHELWKNVIQSNNKQLFVELWKLGLKPTDEETWAHLLDRAAHEHHRVAVKQLLEIKEYDADYPIDGTEKGRAAIDSALEYAQGRADPQVIKWLLDAGADPNRLVGGRHRFVQAMRFDVEEPLRDKMFEHFIGAGGDINASNSSEGLSDSTEPATLMNHSLSFGHWQIASRLLELGAEVDRTPVGGTSLHHAVTQENPSSQVLATLIDKGVPLDAKEAEEGMTALYYTIDRCSDFKQDDLTAAHILLEKGADPSIRRDNKWMGESQIVGWETRHGKTFAEVLEFTHRPVLSDEAPTRAHTADHNIVSLLAYRNRVNLLKELCEEHESVRRLLNQEAALGRKPINFARSEEMREFILKATGGNEDLF